MQNSAHSNFAQYTGTVQRIVKATEFWHAWDATNQRNNLFIVADVQNESLDGRDVGTQLFDGLLEASFGNVDQNELGSCFAKRQSRGSTHAAACACNESLLHSL